VSFFIATAAVALYLVARVLAWRGLVGGRSRRDAVTDPGNAAFGTQDVA
jgi:hypothetical protein